MNSDIINLIKIRLDSIIRMINKDFELDYKAHTQGRCSYSSPSVCAAEEQSIKMKLIEIIQRNK